MKTEYQNETDLTIKAKNGDPIVRDDRIVGQVLRIISDWQTVMARKERENDLITMRLDDVHWARPRQANNKLPPYLLFIVQKKIRKLLRIPDFRLEADRVSEEEKAIVTGLVSDVMDDAGWQDILTGTWGVYDKIVTWGDWFGRVYTFKTDGRDPEQDRTLLTYQGSQLSKVYLNKSATRLRKSGAEGEASECVWKTTMDYDEAIEIWPELYGNADMGSLPAIDNWPRITNDQTPEQDQLASIRKIELAFYYNKRRRIYALIAGSNAYKVFEYKGDDYPFVFWDTGEAYIPIMHFRCFPKPAGIYSTGFCTLFYPLDIVWQELMNRGVAHILDNADPIRVINMPPAQRQTLYRKLEMADAMRLNGGRPLVINEIDPATSGGMQLGQIQTLSTAALSQEFERLISQLRLLTGYLGIKIDDLLNADKPLGTTELELESQGETARMVLDINEDEFEFAVRLAMDAIARDIDDFDATPVRKTIKVMRRNPETDEPVINPLTGAPEEADVQATRGAAARTLRENRWRVVPNLPSGQVKNNVLELSQIMRLLSDPTLGGRFRSQLTRRRAELMGFNPPNDDVATPGALPQGNPPTSASSPEDNLNIPAGIA